MRHFTEEEKERAVNLYFDEKLTTQEVVQRLGYPTRQNLERWLKKDQRYGENIRHGFYPLAKKTKGAIQMQTSYPLQYLLKKRNLSASSDYDHHRQRHRKENGRLRLTICFRETFTQISQMKKG